VNATQQTFTSRTALLLAMLSMAVGTGNIWRFPRIAAANGGGTFLIPWIIFLFMWSIPLLIVEFSMGKGTRYGPVGAFSKLLGKGYAWMGAWVAWCATAIMFYYSVVSGWTLRYFWAAATGELQGEIPGALWSRYPETGWAVLTHAVAIGFGVWVVSRGVKGIERVTNVLLPSLFVLVVLLAVRALTLPGAPDGLAFLFTPDFSQLGNARIWLEALTQNAWDTGAGWGLALTYAVYARQQENTTSNAFLLGIGNNTISILAGIMVICTVFSVGPSLAERISQTPVGFEQSLASYPGLQTELESRLAEPGASEALQRLGVTLHPDSTRGFFANQAVPVETRLEVARATGGLEGRSVAEAVLGSGNNGLTFIWVPQIFNTLPLGRLLTSVFFLALAFAAVTSLISMMELATRVLVDGGTERPKAIRIVGGVGFLMGIPSALSMAVFDNQDFVWGVGLMLSGFFFAFAVIRYGVRRFRENFVNNQPGVMHVGRWWDAVIYLVLAQAVLLMGWWLYQAVDPTDLAATFTPFSPFNVGTLVVQWAIAIGCFAALNGWLARRTVIDARGEPPPGGMPPSIP
jgi:SNF family Na+-dependent transporter